MGSLRSDITVALSLVLVGSILGLSVNWKLVEGARAGEITLDPSLAESFPAGISSITAPEVESLLEKREALIVDARREFFFKKEHIPGALSLPLAQYEKRIQAFENRIAKTQLLVVYCSGYGCQDSHHLSEKLIRLGYQRVGVFYGGIPEWKEAGFPTEGEDATP